MLSTVLLFFDIGGGELFLIMMFVLVFFGSKKIPELARGLGKGMREFKDASAGIRREIQEEADKIQKEVKVIKEEVNLEDEIKKLKE
jgi:sec-independent protein translocase protein TatA